MKTIKVAAAIIKKDNKILIASRKTGEFAGMFEFPGGKVEPGETSKQALIREIQEELETSINIDEFFMNVNYVEIDRPVSIAAHEIAEDLITYKRETL